MSEAHNVFISWSGPRSKWVAEALRDWLPLILQTAKPWMSATDIEKGSRGLDEVSSRLQGMRVGIVCLTPENLAAPWILYEAGALSKTIDDKTRLCTYLLGGLQFQDVKSPLGMFQATNPDKDDTRKLVRTINRAVSEHPVAENNLDLLFERLWPDLDRKLESLPNPEQVAAPKRLVDDIVTELLEIARTEVNKRESLQAQVSHIEEVLNRAPFGDLMTNALISYPNLTSFTVGSAPAGVSRPSNFISNFVNSSPFAVDVLPSNPGGEPEKGGK
jgi:hypothetical protein